jgi:predicted GIY-YIG superfamily endonuclease
METQKAKEWYVYCLATVEEPIQTYIGATVDLNRRLNQHNGLLKGGAKATSRRKASWYRVCYVKGFADNHEALSFEWHWKYYSRKENGGPLERRKRGLQKCLEWSGKELEVFFE